MSVKKQVGKSVFWSAVERFSVQGAGFVLGIVIARMLSPEDYALIAMLNIFMALAQSVTDCGFGNALIQKKDRTDADYTTVFYFNIVVSFILYGALYLSSPIIASFYNQTDLELITKVVGLSLIINSFGIVQQAKLTVELDFKRQAKASLTAVVISGVAGLVMAYSGFGVWALVAQTLLNNFIKVLLFWIYAKWKPQFVFSYGSFKELFSFGSKLMASGLLHTVYVNLYTLIIGKKFMPADLGFYNRAFLFAQFPSNNITNILIRAIYPIQCSLQDDRKMLESSFIKYLRMSCFIIFPLMLGLCALAEPLVRVVLTEKWLGVVPLLRILCISFMWDPVMRLNNSILQVRKRSDYILYAEVIKKICAFIILFSTISFGIEVMCIGLILYSLIDAGIIIFYSRKVISCGYKGQIISILPVLMISVLTGSGMYISTFFFSASLIKLIGGSVIGIMIFMTLSLVFRIQELRIIKELRAAA